MYCQLAPTYTYFSFQDGDLLHTYTSLAIRINYKYLYLYFNPLIFILNHVLFLKVNTLEMCIGSKNLCNTSMYIFFVMHLPENGRMSGQNMYEVCGVYNILSYTYVHLLSRLIAQCTIMGHLKLPEYV
jgi:hypothetical protein